MFPYESYLLRESVGNGSGDATSARELELQRKRAYAVELQKQIEEEQKRAVEQIEQKQRGRAGGSSKTAAGSVLTDADVGRNVPVDEQLDTFLVEAEARNLPKARSVRRDRLDIYNSRSRYPNIEDYKEQTLSLKFRSDKAFMSLAELEEQKQSAKQLQADLMLQIMQKKQREAEERKKIIEQERREEERVRRELTMLRAENERQVLLEKQKKQESHKNLNAVAEAWILAKTELKKSARERTTTQNEHTQSPLTGNPPKPEWDSELTRLKEDLEKERNCLRKEFNEQLERVRADYQQEIETLQNKAKSLEDSNLIAKDAMSQLQQQLRRVQVQAKTNNKSQTQIHSAPRRVDRVQSAKKRNSSLCPSPWDLGAADYRTLLSTADRQENEDITNDGLHRKTAFVYPNGKIIDFKNAQNSSTNSLQTLHGEGQNSSDN